MLATLGGSAAYVYWNARATSQVLAEQHAQIALARDHMELALATIQRQPDSSFLFSIEAFHELANHRSERTLMAVQEASPHLRKFLFGLMIQLTESHLPRWKHSCISEWQKDNPRECRHRET